MTAAVCLRIRNVSSACGLFACFSLMVRVPSEGSLSRTSSVGNARRNQVRPPLPARPGSCMSRKKRLPVPGWEGDRLRLEPTSKHEGADETDKCRSGDNLPGPGDAPPGGRGAREEA